MIWAPVAWVYINEQLVMVHNNCVVHCILFFCPLNHMWCVSFLPWLANLDQSAVNEPITTGKLPQMCTQGHPLFNYGPLDLITKCIDDAWCNDQCIITQCRFRPIPHEHVIFSDAIMLCVEDEIKETLFEWMVCLIQLVFHLVSCKIKKK
jgi:hypothetical protein